jgi:hypothetical protein
MWEEEYEKFLCDIKVMGMQSDAYHGMSDVETDDEME